MGEIRIFIPSEKPRISLFGNQEKAVLFVFCLYFVIVDAIIGVYAPFPSHE